MGILIQSLEVEISNLSQITLHFDKRQLANPNRFSKKILLHWNDDSGERILKIDKDLIHIVS